jgi:syntaxin 5
MKKTKNIKAAYYAHTVVCRKRTIFDDNPVEIQELTFIIKEDIANLNKQIAQLQQVLSSCPKGSS